MKYVIAIIKPHKLDEVRNQLVELGIYGMTVSEVKGFGRQRGHTAQYPGAEGVVDFVPKVRIEVALDDQQLDGAIECIAQTARSGKVGDGKIFVLDLARVMRIRTGEQGTVAL